MRKTSMRVALVILLLLPALTSCRFFRKSKPAPLPAKIPVQTQPAPLPPPQLEPPPQIPPNTEAQKPAGLPEAGTQPIPPPPEEKKRPSPAGRRIPAAAEPPAAAAAAPAAPTPQLRPLLKAAEKQDLERSVSDRIARAQSTLAAIGGRRLNSEQEDMAAQIRTFIRQAEEARTTDLLRANNLAERAEVFAAELAKRLR